MVYDIILGRNEEEKKKFGTKGTIFIGKSYVKMGQTTSLANRMLLDIARTHVILIAGKRGSGKSWTLSAMAEEMTQLPEEIAKNLSIIMFDTMGIFWTMKYPNLREYRLLEEWDLKPKGMNINLFVPEGHFSDYKKKGLPVDFSFTLKTSELGASDWCDVFEVSLTGQIGVLIELTLAELRKKFGDRYDLIDIEKAIEKDKKIKQTVKYAALNMFKNVKTWGVFSKEGTTINDIIRRGEVSVLDLSAYTYISGNWNIKNLVVGLICKQLLAQRIASRKLEELESIESQEMLFLDVEKELEKPLVWIMIDEIQEFLPRSGKTSASEALSQLLREGRQPGISMVLATQQPGEVGKEVLTQSDILISHRLTAKVDIEALNTIMQSYLLSDIQSFMNELPRLKGSALVLDDNSERIYPMRVRPKMSWHGGESPSAIKSNKEKELLENLNIEANPEDMR